MNPFSRKQFLIHILPIEKSDSQKTLDQRLVVTK